MAWFTNSDGFSDVRNVRLPGYWRPWSWQPFIRDEQFRSSHIQFCGASGTGKTALAARILHGQILAGRGVYVLDPKGDSWFPSVLADACGQAGVAFCYIDLEARAPQFNLLRGITGLQEEELYIAGMGLENTGRDSDFYHTAARQRIHEIAERRIADKTLIHAAAQARAGRKKGDEAAGFINALDELARVQAIATREGVDLNEPIERGGCVYVRGSLFRESVLRLMQMVCIRIIQLTRRADRTSRHIAICVDEVKYQLHKPFFAALGTLRDRGANLLVLHQSHGDFPSGEVKATVCENCAIKFLFRSQDPNLQKWGAEMSGTIPIENGRMKRPYIDENMFARLPDGDAVCIGVGLAKRIRVEPVKVVKREFKPVVAAEVDV